jgi:Tol biopolymer transport system component
MFVRWGFGREGAWQCAWLAAAVAAVTLAGAQAALARGVGGREAPARSGVVLVSRASGPDGVKGNDASFNPAISANGRFVAYTSAATNLSPDATAPLEAVYVRDLWSQSTILANRTDGPDGAETLGGGAQFGGISGDGHIVIFTTSANGVTADDTDGRWDVFARNLRTGTTTLVSRADGVDGANASFDATGDSVSADGRLVVFETGATDPFAEELYVRDLARGRTTLVSRATGRDGAPGNDASFDGQISANGRYVTWYSIASNLAPADPGASTLRVYWRDLWTGVTTAVSPPSLSAFDPSISGNGRIVAFDGADAAGIRHVYVRDMHDPSGAVQIVDRASGFDGMLAQPEFFALNTSVSFDGDAVLFETAGFNPGPPLENVFVRDLRRQTTTLVSGLRVMRDPWPAAVWPHGNSGVGSLSADNRLVAFSSSAAEFSAADANGSTDVYVRRLPPASHRWWRRRR